MWLGIAILILVIFGAWQLVQTLHPAVLKTVQAKNGRRYQVFSSHDVEKMAEIDTKLRQILANTDVPNKDRYKGENSLRQSHDDNFTRDKKYIFLVLSQENADDTAVHELAHLLADSYGHTDEWRNIYQKLKDFYNEPLVK